MSNLNGHSNPPAFERRRLIRDLRMKSDKSYIFWNHVVIGFMGAIFISMMIAYYSR